MDITNLPIEKQDLLIQELSQHITSNRWDIMQKAIHERTRHITLVLEDIYQSHNAAAVLRSCDGFGIQDVHIIEKRNKLSLNKTTVAKGADKWLNFHYYNDPSQNNTQTCIKHLKSQGYAIAATTLGKNSIALEEIPLNQPLAIMIGTEKNGLSQDACSQADFFLEIPMYGFIQSYNLSVCAAIVLYTLITKLRNSQINWQLSENEKRDTLLLWLQRCINHWQVFADKVLID